MAKFVYQAKTSPKEIIKGEIISDNKNAAIQKLTREGYYIISLEEEAAAQSFGTSNPRGSFFGRVSLKDLTDFTRQLSDLLESGITIAKALEIIHNQTANKRLKAIISDIRDFCVAGNPLSGALAKHPKVFSNLYVSMVRSGETGGALENILRRLSDFSEKQLEIQIKIRTALAYPALMSVVGTATIIVLMTFVIPKMMVLFGDLGQALPLPTQILLGASVAIRRYWVVIIAAVAAVVAAVVKIYSTPEGNLAIDRMRLESPLFGRFEKKVEIARFSRTLATLLENGVPMLDALGVASETIGNAVMKREVEKARVAVREGSSLAGALQKSAGLIPPAAVNMIAIGEEGGHLEKSLMKVAQGYERESDEAIKIMMSLVEPMLILALGIVVGFIVISMLLPIFEISFMVR